jgi:large conductance mechanosensitive channel protein
MTTPEPGQRGMIRTLIHRQKGFSMAGVLRVPRSRGALSGVVLVLLGAWGALIPFIGPYFQFAYTPGTAWVYTPARLWLEVVPGVASAAGGLILLSSANRAFAAFGAWLAALAGAWFVLGPTVSRLWASSGFSQIGSPLGGTLRRTVVEISYFAGLGVVIVFFAALALGRLAVVATRDAELAAAATGKADTAHPGRETGILRGFRNFLMQGDLIVIAVGLVIALAFAGLIQAFVGNIITPLVNAVGGGAAGQGLGWTINGQRIDLGAFIGAIIYFIIFVAVIYFLLVVPYRAYMRRRGTTVFGEPQPTKTCPECKASDLPIDATLCKYCATRLTAIA